MRHSDCVWVLRAGRPGGGSRWQGGVDGVMLLSLIAKRPKMDAASGGANGACEPALAAVVKAN